MTSTILHTVGAIIAFLILWGISKLSPNAALFVAVAFTLYLREVTQKQTAKYGSDFRYGWNLLLWENDKQKETVIPVLVLAVFAALFIIF